MFSCSFHSPWKYCGSLSVSEISPTKLKIIFCECFRFFCGFYCHKLPPILVGGRSGRLWAQTICLFGVFFLKYVRVIVKTTKNPVVLTPADCFQKKSQIWNSTENPCSFRSLRYREIYAFLQGFFIFFQKSGRCVTRRSFIALFLRYHQNKIYTFLFLHVFRNPKTRSFWHQRISYSSFLWQSSMNWGF